VKIYPDSAHGFLFQHHAAFAADLDEFLALLCVPTSDVESWSRKGGVVDIGSFVHQVTRLVFDTGQPYEEFGARYEDAVPELDPKRLVAFTERGAPWQEIVADADATAPHGFLIYWRSDLTPLMSLAGDPARCAA
jgi:hypothetical protein